MAQQTAVEWLVERFQKFLAYYEGHRNAEPYSIHKLSNDFEQAKRMFEKQIIAACNQTDVIGLDSEQPGEQYYTKTYGK